jgi:uncharacterized protein
MTPKPRYVFDTSAIVSALLFEQSVPARALYTALDCADLLVSSATADELREVPARKKFDRYLTWEEREQFLLLFLTRAIVVEIVEDVRVCRDPKDDKFLELAVSGNASCLLTGDEDLLTLHPFRGIPILPPTSFLEMLGEERKAE